MYQTCQHCGYESPTGARFCRQCGAPHFVETEVSVAATRNYGKQEPPVATAGSGHLPPSVGDAIAGETERYYQPPYAPAPPIQVTAPIKPGIKLWRWMIAFVFVLFIGAAIYALMRGGPRRVEAPMPPEEFARQQREEEAQRRQEELRREAENQIREAENRARDLMNQAREALRHTREAAEQAIEAGAALAPTDEKPLDLSPYEYPGATMGSSIRIPGREILTMRVSDDYFDAVNKFYRDKLGKPIIEINETEMDRLLIFQSNTAPAISVSVEIDNERAGPLLKIVV
ncbi:MAG: zinc-ribbon domain-containing protein, partial [Acidobacteria bacterium]|nr:zinc-ribbon domain-containing protein [Acidobacteriota bacterium]